MKSTADLGVLMFGDFIVLVYGQGLGLSPASAPRLAWQPPRPGSAIAATTHPAPAFAIMVECSWFQFPVSGFRLRVKVIQWIGQSWGFGCRVRYEGSPELLAEPMNSKLFDTFATFEQSASRPFVQSDGSRGRALGMVWPTIRKLTY